MNNQNILRKLLITLIIILLITIILISPIIPQQYIMTSTIYEISTYNTYSIKTIGKYVYRTKVLSKASNIYIPYFGYIKNGPYSLKAGQTITVEWESDVLLNVYILNDADWYRRALGAPTTYRAFKYGTRGKLSYTLTHDEQIYIQAMSPTWGIVKVYNWKVTLSWKTFEKSIIREPITIVKTITRPMMTKSIRYINIVKLNPLLVLLIPLTSIVSALIIFKERKR